MPIGSPLSTYEGGKMESYRQIIWHDYRLAARWIVENIATRIKWRRDLNRVKFSKFHVKLRVIRPTASDFKLKTNFA